MFFNKSYSHQNTFFSGLIASLSGHIGPVLVLGFSCEIIQHITVRTFYLDSPINYTFVNERIISEITHCSFVVSSAEQT